MVEQENTLMERSKMSLVDRLTTGELNRNLLVAKTKLAGLRITDPEAENNFYETLSKSVETDDPEERQKLTEELADSPYYVEVGAELSIAESELHQARMSLKRRQHRN